MQTRRNWIAVAAAVGIAWSVASGVILTQRRSRVLVDTGVTRASVEHSLKTLLPKAAESPRDPALLKAAAELSRAPYVAAAWVVSTAGEIIFRQGGPGRPGDKIQDLTRDDMAPAVDALPAGTLSEEQKLQLLAVAAMRREGDHNDVFRHLARPVTNSAGGLAGIVVLAYDVSPALSAAPGATYMALLLSGLAGFAVYWLGLPLWVAADARARGDAAALWGVFVLFTNLVGLLAYLLVIARPARRAAQAPGL